MKQKDIITLIVTAFFSIVLSIVVSKIVFSKPSNLNQQVDVVPVVSSNFSTPNSQFFNNKSIDPTQIINIGPSNNQQVFNSGN